MLICTDITVRVGTYREDILYLLRFNILLTLSDSSLSHEVLSLEWSGEGEETSATIRMLV